MNERVYIGNGVFAYYNTNGEFELYDEKNKATIILDDDTFTALLQYKNLVENGPDD